MAAPKENHGMWNNVDHSATSLLSNPVFLSAVWSMFSAQFVKVIVNIFRWKKYSWHDAFATFLWRTGGMPSSHSSLVVSLATSVGIVEGPGSNLFIITTFVALIVIRDAMGVCRAAGVQAKSLNSLGRLVSRHFDMHFTPVKEVMGHTPFQVLVGGVLGFFTAIAFCTL